MTRTLVPPRRRAFRALACFAFAACVLAGALRATQARAAVVDLPATVDSWILSGARTSEPLFVPGQVLVHFKSTLPASARARVVREERAEVVKEITPDGLLKVALRADDSVERAVARFRARPEVEYAVPNLKAQAFEIPNDSLITDPDFDWAWNLRIVHAYEAYDIQRGDPRVVLAIIDSGVAHADRAVPEYETIRLWPGTKMYKQSVELLGPFAPGYDFVYDDPYADDDDGHGTNVATIAAGLPNNIAGSAGIAPGITIMPIKVIDWQRDSEMAWITAGIRFAADHGAHILNLSLGFPPLDTFRFRGLTEQEIREMFRPLRDAVNYAQRRGCILVASSGNFGADEVSLPANYPGVIAVGATDPAGNLSSYSSYGRNLDIVAPGGDFGDVNNDRLQDAVFVYSIKPFRSEGSLAKPDSFGVFPFFGTSGSAPHVSGAVALLMSAGLTSQGAIEQTLYSTAVRPPDRPTGTDFLYGAGLLQLDAALLATRGGNSGGSAAAAVRASIATRLLSGNPARGEAAITYRLTHPGRVRVRVFDAQGALVRTLDDRDAGPGERSVRWDGRNDAGARSATGVYFIRVETPDAVATRKIAFLR